MAKRQTSVRDEKREVTRRALLKWSLAAGAALGVSRSKIAEVLERTAGKGLAFAADARTTTRTVHLIAGNGGLAHFTLMWPQVEIAQANSQTFAWHKPGMGNLVNGSARPLFVGPDTPFADLPAAKQVTGFMCGQNQTHSRSPQSAATFNNQNMMAFATAVQSSSPAVIPAVTIADATIGAATGAKAPANVGNADGIVNLFDSAASKMGGLLSKKSDAELYKAHYDGFIQLQRASARPTTKGSYNIASGAAQFLGTNLASKLMITTDDLARYGIDGNTRGNVAAIGRALIVSVKAFSMDLTSSVILPAMDDDPHNHFNGDVNVVPPQLKKVFDGFMKDMQNTMDGSTKTPLADDLVLTVHGDTPKNGLNRNGWGDNTQQNSNQMFVYSSGHLKSGWFGQIKANGTVTGVDATGTEVNYNGADMAKFAASSVVYAVCKRDDRLAQGFSNGVTIGGVFGNLKDK